MANNKLSIKSKLGAEFRRFSLTLKKTLKFNEFKTELEQLHGLFEIPFYIYYVDPLHGDLLPINNDDNFALAISLPNVTCLKLHLQFKQNRDENFTHWSQNGSGKKKNLFENITNNLLPLHSGTLDKNRKLHISFPEDFRQVSSIIDVDIVPDTCRRVRLVKHGSDKPLGFYIRDGTSLRATVKGLEKLPGIFISRLVPGGLAESTGLLAVNDEVLEVNGIEVLGKTLDQVTDMMVANSSNLIITIRPEDQRKPFQYPKAQQMTHSASSYQQQTLNAQQPNHHNHGSSHKLSNHQQHSHQATIAHSKSESNLHHTNRNTTNSSSSNHHHPHLTQKLSSPHSNSQQVTTRGQDASSSNHKADANQRIPLQRYDNTLLASNSQQQAPQQSDSSSNNKPSSYFYLDQSFVKLAPGEDTDDSDEEDEVKVHNSEDANNLKHNNNNNARDQQHQTKLIVEGNSRSNH